MTFADWYAVTIDPQLEQSLKNLPEPTRAPIRQASRESMAACWNAALDAASRLKNPAYTTEDLARRLKELRA